MNTKRTKDEHLVQSAKKMGTSRYLISLFCGAGGLDLGFSKAGYRTIAAYDNNPSAIESFNHNHSGSPARVADIARLSVREILSDIVAKGISPAAIRGVIGGPPCQGFSRGNVAKSSRDSRNWLPYRYAAIVGELRRQLNIDFFLFENVAGLLLPSMSNRWSRIRNAFEHAGFKLFPTVVDASEFGVPQVRKRMILIGLNADKFAINDFSAPAGHSRAIPIESVLRGLPRPAYLNRSLGISTSSFHVNHWTMRPRSRRFESGEFNKWRSFRLLKWNKPSPTVAYGNREIHIHPGRRRRLSVYEAMLLQGFPHSYVLLGTFSSQVTQVCNAVPPPVGEAFALALRSILERKNLSGTTNGSSKLQLAKAARA